MWNGSAGSAYSFFSGTLVRATPLIIVGLAVAVAFEAGVLNIGAEGQLLAGAAAATAAAPGDGGLVRHGFPFRSSSPREWLPVRGWAAIAGVLKRRFGVLEVISTLMLNFVALFGVSYLVRGPLQEPTRIYPQTLPLA